ncbi:hypothetical protein P9112_004866 [Eukaryota sp. TZLM1-RC]
MRLAPVVLLGLYIALLSFTEQRYKLSLDTRQKLKPLCQTIDPFDINTSSSYPIVHFTGPVHSDEEVVDDFFGVYFPNAIRLKRTTEYCQWSEIAITSTEEGESDTTTYTYNLGWKPHQIESLFFHDPTHHNPARPYIDDYTSTASVAHVGKIRISEKILSQLSKFSAAEPHFEDAFYNSQAYQDLGFKHLVDGHFYSAHTPSILEDLLFSFSQLASPSFSFFSKLFSNCNAGDIRTSFESIPSGHPISIIGSLDRGEVVPVKHGQKELLIVRSGVYSVDEMFESAVFKTRIITLLVRFCSLFIVWCCRDHLGFSFFFNVAFSLYLVGGVVCFFGPISLIRKFSLFVVALVLSFVDRSQNLNKLNPRFSSRLRFLSAFFTLFIS